MNRLSRYLLFSALVWPAASLADPAVDALPSAPEVTVGDVTFSLSDSAAPTLDIHQSTGRAVISWDQFDVGADATVNFNQPNAQASTLNKVNGVAPSQIFGQINAPGEVILQNAAGVYFGPNSRLDVGALTATSMHIDEAKYLDGAYAFHGNGTLGHIINEGEIRAAENGYVALLAPEVRNAGLVVAHMGSVVMASGEHIVLDFNSNSHLTSITATAAQVDTLIENRHAVRASGGTIILSASAMGSLVSGVINMTGTLDASHEAAGVATIGGRIHLVASDYLSVDNATIQANGAQGGDIKLSASQQVSITNTVIEATGASEGGTILIGNDAQDGSLPFAQTTTLDSATHLDASGDAAGGFIETSGQSLSMLASVDVGAGGTWLIDPFDLTIDLALAESINSALGNNANVTLTTAQETNAIASTPDPTTATGTSGNGDIYVDAAITSAGDGDLTLIADNDIHLNAEISLSGTDSGVTLTAANMTHLGTNITTTGDQVYNSDITLLSGVTLNSGGAAVTITGNIAAQTGVAAFLGNGDYLFNGTSYTAGASANTEHPIGVIYDSANDVYSWLARTSAADILLVAGGGGGGMDMGGGGGGGGVIAQSVALTPGWLDLSVGAGGAGAPAGCTSAAAGRCGHQWTVNAQSGGNSTLQTASGTLTAIGGGYGGTGPWNHQLQGRAASGGSGGGAAGYNAGTSGRNGAGTQGQGHAGASGTGSHVSGGGGGAGAPGQTGRSHGASVGGAGIENCILGTCYYWGGGGGGSGYSYNGGSGGIGGGGGGAVGTTTGGAGFNNGAAGGGGNIGQQTNRPGGHGGVNTGGGGGGGSHYSRNNQGGDGGSGIVVASFQSSLTINAGAGAVTLSGNIDGAGLTINSDNASSQVSGAISGDVGLTKQGTGALTLSASNSYTGATVISAGTLLIGASGALPDASAISIGATSTLDLNDISETVGALSGDGVITNSGSGAAILTVNSGETSSGYAGILQDSATGTLGLTKQGTGTLSLTGANSYTGATSLAGGYIGLGSATALGAGGVLSFDGGGVQYSASNTTDFSSGGRLAAGAQDFNIDTNGQDIVWAGDITQAASSFTKTGAGNLTLSGTLGSADIGFDALDMTLGGGNIILSGTVHGLSSLVMAADASLTTSGALSVSGAASLGGSVTSSGALSFAGATTLVADTTLISSDHDVTFGGSVNGEYELTITAGSGAVALGSVGDTTPISRLEVASTAGIALNGNITTVMGLADGWLFEKFDSYFPNNTTLFATRNRKIIRTNELPNATGSQHTMVHNEMAICPSNNCDSNYTYRVTGYFIPTHSGNWSFSFNGDDSHLLYMGTSGQSLSDFKTIVESNSTWSSGVKNFLTGNPGCCGTQTGSRSLNAGEMYPIYGSMGEGGGGDYFNLRLRRPDGSYIAGSRGNTSYGTGLYFTESGVGGSSTRAGTYFTGAVTLGQNVIITSPTATVSFSDSISGTGAQSLTIDTSTFSAGNVSSLAGIDVQTVIATLGTVSGVTNAEIGAATINTGDVSNVDTLSITSSTINMGTIDVNTSVTLDNSSANINLTSDVSGTGKLIKQGANVVTLSGTNSFTGGVDIEAGTLLLSSASALGSTGSISMLGGTMKFSATNATDYSPRFAAVDNQAFNFDTAGQNVTLASNLVSTGGVLSKTGAGRLTLSGANTYDGTTTISVGELYLDSANALGGGGDIVMSGATLYYSANFTGDVSSRFTNAANQQFRVNTNGQDITWASGLVSSGGMLYKTGAGALTLSAAGNYSAASTIHQGALIYGVHNALPTGVNLTVNASVDLNGFNATIQNLSGGGAVTSNAAGAVTLSIGGTSNVSNNVVISDGAGVISLIKQGSGELTLSGASSYTGTTTISAGTLSVGHANGMGIGGDIVFAGGTLKYAGTHDTDFSSRLLSAAQAFKVGTNGRNITWATDILNPASSLTKNGAGTLTISGTVGVNNSDPSGLGYDAAFMPINLFVNGGTLSLPGDVVSVGDISLLGGGLNCPSCPSLGDVVAEAGSSVAFSAAIFDSLTLAAGVTMTASSVTVYNQAALGGTITTTGPVTFGGAVTLVAPTTITSNDNPVSFNATINGFTSLEVNAGSSTVSFLGAIGQTANLSALDVTAMGGIALNDVSMTGLANGLFFEKFDGNHANDTRRLVGRAQQNVKTTEIATAPGNQQGQVYHAIDICRRGNCDSSYTYRITGYFIPEYSGNHTFSMYGDDQNYLYLGTAGQGLADYQSYIESVASYNKTGLLVAQTGCCSVRSGTRNLTAGEVYPLYVVFMEGGGGDYLRVKWTTPSGNPAMMPGSSHSADGTGYFYNMAGAGGGGGSVGGLTLTGPVTLNQDVTILSENADVTINGTVSGAGTHSLTLTADTLSADAFDDLAGLDVNVSKDSAIDGIISGTATNFVKQGEGNLALTATNSFSGSTTVSGGTLTVSQSQEFDMSDPDNPVLIGNYTGTLGDAVNPLVLTGATLAMSDIALTLYDLTMDGQSAITSIGTTALTLPDTLPAVDGVEGAATAFTLGGNIETLGAFEVNAPITLSGHTTIVSNGGDITFGNIAQVDGGSATLYNLSFDSGAGTTQLSADLSNLGSFVSAGPTVLNLTSLVTDGAQSFGALTLGGSLQLTANNAPITFSSTISGAFALNVDAGSEPVSFLDAVGADTPLVSLQVAGDAMIYGEITTVGDQLLLGNLSLSGNRTLTSQSGNVTLGGNVTAVGSAVMALLGNGLFMVDGDSYDYATSPTSALAVGLSYSSETGLYGWTAPTNTAQVLLVAGGGGGGMDMGGGGGGGGVIASSAATFVTGNQYDIGVGAGGAGAPAGCTSAAAGRCGHQWTVNAQSGGNSTLQTASGTLTAIGGGYGGTGPWNHQLQGRAASGGSGGGAAGYNAGTSGRNGAGTQGQGHAGASGTGSHVSGGGGGAGAPGQTGRSHGASVGGAGIENCILGTCYYWGGGGGGSGYSYNGGSGGIGGGGGGAVGTTTGGAGFNNGAAGGGGNIGQQTNRPGGHGGVNTGGGGGGGSHYNRNNRGGDGGSGIIVVKYATDNSLIVSASNGAVNLPSDLRLSDLNSFTVVEQTVRDYNFTSLALVNTPFDLVNQKLTTSTLSVDSGSTITNSSGYAMIEVSGASSIGGTITTSGQVFAQDDPVLLARENAYQAAILEDAAAVVKGRADYVQSEWGQFYGGAMTITNHATFSSNGKNIHLNQVVGNNTGEYDLTINADTGWVVFNGEIGDKAIVVSNNSVINQLNANRAVYYGNMNYMTETMRASNNVRNLVVTGNEIFIRDDITTYYDQTYTGHVQIGDNGTMVNGALKTKVTLMSVDPTISFIGRSVLYQTEELGQVIYKQTEQLYTFDDESTTPTHTLELKAKGACWVTGGTIVGCQNDGTGNIFKGLDADGNSNAFYNSLSPLLNVIEDNVTMLFPRGNVVNNINIDALSIPQGSISGQVNRSEGVSYGGAITTAAFDSGPPVAARGPIIGGNGLSADSRVANDIAGLIGTAVKSPFALTPAAANIAPPAYQSDVVIGNVRSSFGTGGGFADIAGPSPTAQSAAQSAAKPAAQPAAKPAAAEGSQAKAKPAPAGSETAMQAAERSAEPAEESQPAARNKEAAQADKKASPQSENKDEESSDEDKEEENDRKRPETCSDLDTQQGKC